MNALRGWITSTQYDKIPDSKDEKKPIIKKDASQRICAEGSSGTPSFRSSKDKAREQAQRLLENKYF